MDRVGLSNGATKRKVLVIDDSKTIRSELRVALEQAGYAVVEASDGQEGLEKIRKTADVAMVICDEHMPRLTGVALIETLRAEGLIPNLPVVMLTTEAHRALIERAKQAGAKGWLVKPCKPEHLVAVVKKLAR